MIVDAEFEAVAVVGASPPVIRLRGELDVAGEDEFDRALGVVMAASPSSVAIDLSGVTFIGSTGIRALVKTVNAVGDVRIRGASAWMRRLFEVATVTELFRLE